MKFFSKYSDMLNSNPKELSNLGEKNIQSEVAYTGSLLKVLSDTVILPNNAISKRELIRHVGASCIVPITNDKCVIVERQFRYPINKVITELPAGKKDKINDDPLDVAKRELKEETGIVAKKWTYMGAFHPAVAYTDEKIDLYIAQDLSFGEQKLDEDEFLELYKIPFNELLNAVMDGKITDGKTQTAILKANIILNIQI